MKQEDLLHVIKTLTTCYDDLVIGLMPENKCYIRYNIVDEMTGKEFLVDCHMLCKEFQGQAMVAELADSYSIIIQRD